MWAAAADSLRMNRLSATSLLLALGLALSGCEQLGIESIASINARKEADAKAIGGACRHAARAIEDCYNLNKKADKAAIYAGWREMNEYMIENKLEPVLPVIALDNSRAAQAAETSPEPERVAAKAAKH